MKLVAVLAFVVLMGCSSAPRVSSEVYRDVIADPVGFSGKQVIVEGIWERFFEHSLLRDSDRPDLPVTWVEVDENLSEEEGRALLKAFDTITKLEQFHEVVRLRVKLKGVFRHRRNASIFASSGFGHLGQYSSELLITEIVEMSPEPIQSIQHNAGSRPSSGDSPASEIPSALAPRG